MFKRILIPTDGSPESQRAILAGVALARETGAEIVGMTVIPPFDAVMTGFDMLETTPEQYQALASERARRILADVEQPAQDAKVSCTLEAVTTGAT